MLTLSVLWLLHRRNVPAKSGAGKEYIGRHLPDEMERLDREYKERRGRLDEGENEKRYADELRKVLDAVETMKAMEARREFDRAVRRFVEAQQRGKV